MERLHEQLIRHEGLRLGLYKCPADKWTIGVGHNIEDLGISSQVAMMMLNEDVDRALYELLENLPWVAGITPVRREVFVNMVFNLGITSFLGFKKMLAHAEIAEWHQAALEGFDSKWARQVGQRANELMAQLEAGKKER